MQEQASLNGLHKLDRTELENIANAFYGLYGSAREEIKIVEERAKWAQTQQYKFWEERDNALLEMRRLERENRQLSSKISELARILIGLSHQVHLN